jgi:hypothetical protein
VSFRHKAKDIFPRPAPNVFVAIFCNERLAERGACLRRLYADPKQF